MKVAVKFHEQEFKSSESKKAYLKACKWLAKHVVSKSEIGETFWKVIKVEGTKTPTFIVELWAAIDDDDIEKSFCKSCKEFHSLFYLNQQFNCSKCNMKAYVKKIESKLMIKSGYRDERLKYIVEKRKGEK